MFVGVAMIATRIVRPLAYVLGAPGARFGGSAGKPGPRERGQDPGANGIHGRRRHDRPRADHVRGGDRPGLQELVHGRRQHALRRRLLGLGRRATANRSRARPPMPSQPRPASRAVSQMRSGEAKVGGKTVFVTGVDKSLTKVVDIHVEERFEQRPRGARHERSVRPRPVRRRQLAEGRLAARDRDADRQDHPGPCHRDRRPAQGRLAVRRDLGVRMRPSTRRSQTTTTSSRS